MSHPTTLADVFPATACGQTSSVPQVQVFLRSLSKTAAGTVRMVERCTIQHTSWQRPSLLEGDFEAAAGSTFDRLLGVFV